MTPLAFVALFAEFRAASWNGWRAILARLTPVVREFYAVVGRGAGKSRFVALLACIFAARTYRRAAGESIYVGVFAPDRKQAGITFAYIVGLLRSVPSLAALIQGETKESLTLSTGIIIEVLSATIAAPRGRSYALVIIEEAAFLPQDQSANPDVELLRAVRPALARVPGSLLAVVGSPYARRGVLWNAWQRYHDQPDSAVVFVQADTRALNPVFDERAIAQAYEDDPASAAAEYGAQFRTDVETFIAREAIDANVVPGRYELAFAPTRTYTAFLDFAGGSGADSATCAIAHEELRKDHPMAVLDVVREVRPPFSPETVCREFAALLTSYGVSIATADRFAGEFPVEQMRKHQVSVQASERSKSEIYRELLPALNSGRVELLDVPRLHAQLAGLERRTARGGRDSIDHAPGGHDDVANAACGALVEASLPVARGAGIGHVVTDEEPALLTQAEMQHLVDDPAARSLWHQSQLGRTRRVSWPADEDDDAGGVVRDGNPFL